MSKLNLKWNRNIIFISMIMIFSIFCLNYELNSSKKEISHLFPTSPKIASISNFTDYQSFGGEGNQNGQFKGARGIALNSTGAIYVVDEGNSRIQIFDKNGYYLNQFGSNGSASGQFHAPVGIAINNSV